jgi:hypothetical protein
LLILPTSAFPLSVTTKVLVLAKLVNVAVKVPFNCTPSTQSPSSGESVKPKPSGPPIVKLEEAAHSVFEVIVAT